MTPGSKGGSKVAANYLKTLRLFSRDVRLYFVTTTIYGFTVLGGIYPVLFNLYLLRLGYGPEFVGIANAVSSLSFAAFSLPAGALGRRFGIRRAMIAGLGISAVGFILQPLAEFVPATLRSVWLLVTRLPTATGLALYFVNVNPFLMSATSPEERGHVFSVPAALGPLAGFVGSIVGGLLPGLFAKALGVSLDSPVPYRYPLLIASILLIPGVLAMAATREVGGASARETPHEEGVSPFSLIALLSLFMLLRGSSEAAVMTFLNVYLDDSLVTPTARIGTILAFGQLLAVPAALSTPFLMARLSKGRTVSLGSLGIALSLLPLVLIPHWGAAGISFMGIVALSSIVRPAFSIYSMEMVPQGWQTATSGAITMASGLSFSVMSLGGGYLITALGYPVFFVVSSGLTAVGVILFWAYFRAQRRKSTRRSALGKVR